MDIEIQENVETATYMDVDLYKAAVDGKIEAFNDYKGRLERIVTPNQNTVLHVYLANRRHKAIVFHMIYFIYYRYRASTLRSTEFVEHLLNQCSSLLLQANAKGEIPLHIEARYGHRPTVKLLLERAKFAQQGDLENGIEAAKEMLRIRDNKEENTPLHIAARYGHLEVVRALVEADPDFVYPANKYGETPLYIAARRGYHHLVAEMLTKCKSVAHAGPKGTTALHAAVMANDRETVRIILKMKKILASETDDNGRSPLHFAAHLGYRSIVKQILECDKSTSYIVDFEGKMTALHMAARQSHASIMKEIIRHCPDCCELVDKRGWNFLHFAAVTLYRLPLRQFFGDDIGIRYVSMENLLSQKDEHGNTPLQLLVTSRPNRYGTAMMCTNDKMELGKENLTMKEEEQILNLLTELGSGEVAGVPFRPIRLYRKAPFGFEKARESHLVVAALIATVTFAAAFTIPGGYKTEKGVDEGTAILIRNAAFNMFVISNAIAVVSSLLAVLFHFLMARPRSQKSFASYPYAYRCTLFAVGAMVIAFITGAFAVLEPSLGLAITTCLIGLSFFLVALCVDRSFALLDVA
ncbi:ankyrin repeat-containing protein NPR4-like isoform X1 [Durio zibethinus]|uniref:Ankyrin repeat-containing protein NPR4-like isoform X1 n=1 Tax=Durio zibethinus TaxID=66656 RepID=A0A6P6A5H3_DURZI|nr:ankyrin repeat-containing protein NPR4-like isoform X1 [Durio zibethinus]